MTNLFSLILLMLFLCVGHYQTIATSYKSAGYLINIPVYEDHEKYRLSLNNNVALYNTGNKYDFYANYTVVDNLTLGLGILDQATSVVNIHANVLSFKDSLYLATGYLNINAEEDLSTWDQELILPKAQETVRVTQLLYSEGELTFLRLLEAQRILTETELSYVQSQGTRWASAAEIANLLQLEDFPLTMATPAAIDLEFVKQEDAMERQPPELIPPPPQ